jgi:SAM-dependent methyltransferase
VEVHSKERFPFQNFHNYHIKLSLFELSSPSCIENRSEPSGRILDLCSGKGVDIIKIRNARYREFFGMDIDAENIKYAKNFYDSVVPVPKPRAFYIRGDASRLIFPNQSCCYTETDKIQFRKQIPVKYHFDTVCSLFCIHYFFKHEIALRTFLQNVTDNLKIGGHFIGTCFDGIRIYDALKNEKSISGKTFSQETLWKIDKKYTKKMIFTKNKCHYGTEIDVFVKSIGNVHTEYLVNFLFLDKIMEEYGFELVTRKSFEEYYNELIESTNPDQKRMRENAFKMSEEEKRFSFLNSGFMYRKVKNSSDQLLRKLIELMEKEIQLREKRVAKVSIDTEHNIEELESEMKK